MFFGLSHCSHIKRCWSMLFGFLIWSVVQCFWVLDMYWISNGHRYTILFFSILLVAISLCFRCLGKTWILLRFRHYHEVHYWFLYPVSVCDMGILINVWGGTTFFSGWKNWVPIIRCENVLVHGLFSSYYIIKTTFFLLWKKNIGWVYSIIPWIPSTLLLPFTTLLLLLNLKLWFFLTNVWNLQLFSSTCNYVA